MWARVVEVMLGCWLAMSPAIFERAEASAWLWGTDLAAALLVITFALASYWRPTRHAHLLTLLVAAGLLAIGFQAGHPAPAAHQNHIVVALLLIMTAIIPNQASSPPEGWQRFRAEHREMGLTGSRR